MTGRVIPAAVNWAQLLKQTAPADKKLMAAFKVKETGNRILRIKLLFTMLEKPRDIFFGFLGELNFFREKGRDTMLVVYFKILSFCPTLSPVTSPKHRRLTVTSTGRSMKNQSTTNPSLRTLRLKKKRQNYSQLHE